jgi:hypothetical protein
MTARNNGTPDDLGRHLLRMLKENDVRLVSYVPDNVLTPLIAAAGRVNQVRRIPRWPSERVARRGTLRPRLGGFSAVSTCSARRRVRR